MKMYTRRWGASSMLWLPYTQRNITHIHQIGGEVAYGASLAMVANRKILAPCQKLNNDSSCGLQGCDTI
jgi:uncharacterized metal-binding protein